jgi:Ca-activated chloride channel family protein
MRRAAVTVCTAFATLLLAALAHTQAQSPQDAAPGKPLLPGGELQIVGPDGAVKNSCPLKHTDVVANVAGILNRTHVKQTFHNPLNEEIEAIYVFPLPDGAAVDEMVMTVGDRRIVGQVKKREDARAVYEQAKSAGQVASLLDQERPNVFTQSVANIEPGAQVTIEIAYVETLKFEDGWYEFSFPMVVGPRYSPGQVADAAKIKPPVTPQGTRAGHDISLTVNLDPGMKIQEVECRSHVITKAEPAPGKMTVSLRNEHTIPNKDFILRYRTATDAVADALLTHTDGRGSFFTLVLQPPQKVQRKDAVGRELIFVLDTSGSMQGFPITQAKFVMAKAIDSLGPQDTFNLITFSGDTHVLWESPRPNTPANREEAQSFLASRQGSGGTEMMKAIEAALVKTARAADAKPQAAGGVEPIRVVCFMTDGYVGNDMQIIDAVKKNAGTTRVFSFGIGSSVNRYLLDGMARAGRGEVEYVTLDSKAEAAAERFYKRIDAPVLTDVALDFGDLPVADVYPKRVPDLFSAKPILVHGRLTGDVKPGATITLRGNTAAGPFERKVQVNAAPHDASHEALASLWARTKVDDLMTRDLAAVQSGTFPEDLKNQVTALGVEFKLMTQFTSFVAVEEVTITKGGKPTTVAVPVEMPEGVSYEGIFGEQQQQQRFGRGAVAAAGVPGMYATGASGGFASNGALYQRSLSEVRQPQKVALSTASAAAPAPPASAPAPGQAAGRPVTGTTRLADREEAAVVTESVDASKAAPDPAMKLDESIRDLAEVIDKQGRDGSFTSDKVTVTDYRLDVMVFLSDASPQTLESLKKLGFVTSGESKAVRLLFGTIDVRKLKELAKLNAVRSVKPVRA